MFYVFTCSFKGYNGLPTRSGKLKELDRFDAAFFGVHPKQANAMDPQLRMLLEVTYEAIVDSGMHYVLRVCAFYFRFKIRFIVCVVYI